MDSPSESLLSSPARNPHIQSTEPLSPEEIAKIYSNNEAEAVAAVKRIIQEYRNDSWQNSSLSKSKNYNKIQMRDEEVADGLAKSLLQAIINHLPHQNFLLLYVRWSKKVPNNFQSDLIAVAKCVVDQYSFGSMQQLLMKYYDLHYLPRRKSRRTVRPPLCLGVRTTFKRSNIPFKGDNFETDLGNKFMALGPILKNSSALGKSGMRDGTGPSNSTRQFFIKELEELTMANLAEFHKPQLAKFRVTNSVQTLSLPLLLINLLFGWKQSPKLLEFCMQLTLGAKDRHSFMTILAGVVILFPTQDSISREDKDRYIKSAKSLQADAQQAAQAQPHQESKNNIIVCLLRKLRRQSRKISLHGQRGHPDRQYILVASHILVKWLKSDRVSSLTLLVINGLDGADRLEAATKKITQKRKHMSLVHSSVMPEMIAEQKVFLATRDLVNREMTKHRGEFRSSVMEKSLAAIDGL